MTVLLLACAVALWGVSASLRAESERLAQRADEYSRTGNFEVSAKILFASGRRTTWASVLFATAGVLIVAAVYLLAR